MHGLFCSVLLALVSASLQAPLVGFPFDQQLPEVARVGQPYRFQLSNNTFLSNTDNTTLSFMASDMPTWLTFDPASRTLSGTAPTPGEVSFLLTGSDSQSSLTVTCKLQASEFEPPAVVSSTALFSQLKIAGETNGVDGLVLLPGQAFSLPFETSALFREGGHPLVAYYGRSSDSTSLPPWIRFLVGGDGVVTFSGTAPEVASAIAPAQAYGFSLIATDYAGYLGVKLTFYIMVGAHKLYTTTTSPIPLNGTTGEAFTVAVPIDTVFETDGSTANGTIIAEDAIARISLVNAPTWITLDTSAYTLSGSFVAVNQTTRFAVAVLDNWGNLVELPFEIEGTGAVFVTSSLPLVNATRLGWFTYTLPQSALVDADSTTIEADISAPWLVFHPLNWTLNGMVPTDFSSLALSLKGSRAGRLDSLALTLEGVDKEAVVSSSVSSSSTAASSTVSSSTSGTTSTSVVATPTASTTASPTVAPKPSKKSNKTLAIALGVALPVAALLAALVIFLCCRRKTKESVDTESISKPQPVEVLKEGIEIGSPSPSQLAAQNLRKLDGLGGMESTSSSITHVDENRPDRPSSDLFDNPPSAVEALAKDAIPRKSWRGRGGDKRNSVTSMATIETENLYSVRLVDDDAFGALNRKSTQMLLLATNRSSTISLPREDSGNIQRLNSEGNLETIHNNGSSLDILKEESIRTPNLDPVPSRGGTDADFVRSVSDSGDWVWTPDMGRHSLDGFADSAPILGGAKLVEFPHRRITTVSTSNYDQFSGVGEIADSNDDSESNKSP